MLFVIKKKKVQPHVFLCLITPNQGIGRFRLQRITEILGTNRVIKFFWTKSILSHINKEMDFIINSEFPGKRSVVMCCNLLIKFQ